MWEFAPAAHAGPYSHDDRRVTLRATRHRQPDLPACIALGSALWLLDLADRAPDVPEIGLPTGAHVPVGLCRAYRIVRFDPRLATDKTRGLDVHMPATVLVHLAHRPTGAQLGRCPRRARRPGRCDLHRRRARRT